MSSVAGRYSSTRREWVENEMSGYDKVVERLRPYLDPQALSMLPSAREGYRGSVDAGSSIVWDAGDANCPYWGAVFVFQRTSPMWNAGVYERFDYLPGRRECSDDGAKPWWPDPAECRPAMEERMLEEV